MIKIFLEPICIAKKTLTIIVVFFIHTNLLFSQNLGDYRTIAGGNWNATNVWQRYNGTSWISVTSYPGQVNENSNVEIRDNHNIQMNISPAFSIASLTINGGSNDSYLTFSPGQVLTVTGQTYLNSNSNNDEKAVRVDAGSFYTGSVVAESNGNSRDAYIRISTGNVYVSGDIALNSTSVRTYILFTNNGSLFIGGTINGGNITSTVSGGTNAPTSGTVIYNANSGSQLVGNYAYYDLNFTGNGIKTLQSDISVHNCNVNSNLFCGAYVISESTNPSGFVLEDAAVLGIGHGQGISASGALGNIQLDTRTFSSLADYTYNGTTSQITGDGIPSSVNNFTINNVNGVTMSKSVAVENTLTLTNGNLTLGDYNLTLADGATISGSFDATHMIVTSGTGALIKESTAQAGLAMVYPVGTGTFYTPMTLANVSGTLAGTASISVKANTGTAPNAGTTDLNKYWEVSTSNISDYTADISFLYNVAEVLGVQGNYKPLYSASVPSLIWTNPVNSSAAGVNPVSSTGNSNIAGTWTAGVLPVTYYSLKSGNWTDPTTWTLDPAGMLPNNPSNTYPQTSGDNAVIKDGKTVTMNASGITSRLVTVDGRLDMAATSGHTITTLRGTGRILLSSDYWPLCDDTHFITAGQGEGTVVYYGNSFSINAARSFYNMETAMTAGQILTLMNNITLAGNLSLTSGTLRINDNTSTVKKTLTVNGNIVVNSGSFFTVGQGDVAGTAYNSYHDVICNGNFTNNGTVQFSNQAQPTYNALATNGGVNLYMGGASDNTFACNNTTNLYRLVVDKGSDQTYILSLDVDQTKYFRLYAANNTNDAGGVGKALYIANGTLRLQGDVFIPSLTEGNADYYIPTTGCLWIDSPGATVYSTATSNAETTIDGITSTGVRTTADNAQSFSIYGKLRVSDGLLKTNSHGLVVWAGYDAIVQIEGGTVYTPGLRSASASTGKYSYIQTGGNVYMCGDINSDGLENQSATFSIKGSDNVFIMSGGTLEIQDANWVTAVGRDRAFEVYASSENTSVTGGTIRIYNTDAGGGNNFYIYTTTPFYNFDISSESTTATNVYLESNLEMKGNLSIGNYGLLDVTVSNYNVSVGGNFSVGATSSSYNSRSNKTTFTGSQNTIINNQNAAAISFYDLILAKNSHPTTGSFYTVTLGSTGSFNVARDFTITRGQLETGAFTPNITRNIEIIDGAITNTTGKIILTGTGAQTLKGADGAEQEFGSIQLNNGNNTVQLLSEINLTNLEFNSSGTGKVNIGANNLTVGGTISNYNTDRYLYGSGNASDGGLSLYVSADGTYTFPVGVSAYTPNQMVVSGFADDGFVTCTPVSSALSTTNPAGGALMAYFWKVNHNAFTTLPQVTYNFTYALADNTSYYPGKVLDESPFTRSYIDDVNKVDEAGNTIVFDTPFTLEKCNYTAGYFDRFTGTVRIFYSRDVAQEANWRATNAWTFAPNDLDGNGTVDAYELHDSRQPGTGAIYPVAGDVAVVGWIPWTDLNRDGIPNNGTGDTGDNTNLLGMPHGIWVDNRTETCAEVQFTQMTDALGNPVAKSFRSNFQFRPNICLNYAGQLNTGLVRGEGMFWCRYSDPLWSAMDIGEFAAEDSSYVVYETTGGTLANTAAVFPNLLIATDGWGAADRDITLSENIVTTGNFEILGDANILLSTGTSGDITIGRDLYMFESFGVGGGAKLLFGNTGSTRTVTVGRDIILDNNGALIAVNLPSTANPDLMHNLWVGRNIYQNTTSGGGLDLWTANNQDLITLTLYGNESMTYNLLSGAVMDLYNLTVNKGNDITTTATFNGDFNLNGPTSGAGIPKALVLSNGLFIVNNGGITIDLTTGNDNFQIPSAAGLEVALGTVTASGTSGIDLDGLLRISGGTLNMSGADNPIVISASGNASLEVSSGSLTVGGQIRRGANTDIGILNYVQTGGTVIAGASNTTVTNRGTLEVMGTGSNFTLTGGDLYIARAASASIPALYLMPQNSAFSATGKLYIGSVSTTGQTLGIYSTAALNNLEVINTNTAKMLTVPLSVSGNIDITSGTFNANGLNLYVGGDFTNGATFTANNNTTFFNGSSDQYITGATTFYNLSKSQSNTLILNDNCSVSNELIVSAGSLKDNGNTLSVFGNCTMNGTQVHLAGGKGIYLTGTMQQQLLGSGTFGMLTMNNNNGVNIPVGNSFTITSSLSLESGVLYINKNLLTLAEGCEINEANPFTVNNMIQTNVSFTDNGIKKYFPSGVNKYTIPVGSGGRYTPVNFDFTSTSAGSITVKAAAEIHPSIQEDTEVPAIVDADNVLQYHWIIISDALSGFTGTIKMEYDEMDVRVTAPYTILDYTTARLLADGSGLWNKFNDVTKVDETTHELTFDFTNVSDDEISGDYTAGVPNAIPDNVPIFISVHNGLWSTQANWAIYDPATSAIGIPGDAVPSGGPRGCIVYIQHDIAADANFISSYQTITLSNGIFEAINGYYGHRLGLVSGTGKILLETGDLPAGIYTDFLSATKGTLEYSGTGVDYDILTEISALNNLILSGTGQRRFPNLNFQVYGDFSLNGATVVNEHSCTWSVQGDIYFNSGTYEANSGTLVLNGNSVQGISGTKAFTGTDAFYNVTINNPGGVLISSGTDIDNRLTLSNGIVTMGANQVLALTNNSSAVISGGSTASYVNGKMSKKALAGQGFVFPIGNAAQYKRIEVSNASVSTTWSAQYLGDNSNGVIETSPVQDIIKVSNLDRWLLGCPVSATGKVTLYWNLLSDVGDGVTAPYTDLRVAMENAAGNWISMGNSAWSGTQTNGALTSNSVSFSDHFFTLGSTSSEMPLPVELLSFDAYAESNGVVLNWETASELNNDYFEIQRAIDAIHFNTIAKVYGKGTTQHLSTYTWIDTNPNAGTNYYRLKQVDFNGAYEIHKTVAVNWDMDPDLLNDARFALYPNPYNWGTLTLQVSNYEENANVLVFIYDLNGKLVLEMDQLIPATKQIAIDGAKLQHLEKGIYLVNVYTHAKTHTKKLIIN